MIENIANSSIKSSTELKNCVKMFLTDLSPDDDLSPESKITITSHATRKAYLAQAKGMNQDPVYCEGKSRQITLHLCVEDLKGIHTSALQGWVDLELALFILKQTPEKHYFNFSKQILPLFNVTGGAVPYIRNMVEYIKMVLLTHLATKRILDQDRGLLQVHYYLYKMGLNFGEQEVYDTLANHSWQRSFFLLKKLQEYLPILMLDDLGFYRGFKDTFWDCHRFITSEDRMLIEELTQIPDALIAEPFANRLVAVFELIKRTLLTREGSPRRG